LLIIIREMVSKIKL